MRWIIVILLGLLTLIPACKTQNVGTLPATSGAQ